MLSTIAAESQRLINETYSAFVQGFMPTLARPEVEGTPAELVVARSTLTGEHLLPQGRLRYFRRGDGPVVVFAHGWLANANLWRRVIERLAGRFACIALDLPFGAHRVAMNPDADLSPSGCGDLITSTLSALDLVDVTLVGNDSGGAYSQICSGVCPTARRATGPELPRDAL